METKIVERIRKLLALASDKGATEAEALLAAEKAAELMREHGLEMATIEASGGTGEARARDSAATVGLQREKWAETLMRAIAEAHFVSAQALTVGNKVMSFSLIGRKSAVTSCRVMYEYLARTVIRLSRTHDGSKRYFRFGCAERLAERILHQHHEALQAQKQRPASSPQPSTALVVVLEDYARKERDLNRDFARGVAPGTTEREDVERKQRRQAHARVIEECQRQHNISWDIAWWMVEFDMTIEQATKREEENVGSKTEYKEYVDYDQRRRRSESFRAGTRSGDSVGLNKQVAK